MGVKSNRCLKTVFAVAASALLVSSSPTAYQAAPQEQQRFHVVLDHHHYTPSVTYQADTPQIVHLRENRIAGRLVEERSCLSLNDFLANPSAYRREAPYQSLMTLYNASSFSRTLMNNAADQNVQVCDMRLQSNIAGVHIPSQNKIGLDFSRGDSIGVNMIYLSHEFAHYAQFLNGAVYFDANRSVYENQRAVIAMETAAPVAEVISIFLADQNGVRGMNRAFPRHVEESGWYRSFKKHYRDAKQDGMDNRAAVNHAAALIWQKALKSQGKLDYYNDAVIAFTLTNIGRINPQQAANFHDPNLADTVNGAGRLSEDIGFTSDAAMPRGDAMFGNNDRMREAFAAIEWYRQSRIYGADHQYVQELKTYLERMGNRYINADFTYVTQRIQNGSRALDALSDGVRHAERRASNDYVQPYQVNSMRVTYNLKP